MTPLRAKIIRAGFDALYLSGAHRLLRPLLGGIGVILMLHRVRPAQSEAFQPNQHLEITPDFLRTTLTHVRDLGFDIIGVDEMHRRLTERDFSRRFACFTFDDGYRDNRDFALPVMHEYNAPFTMYAASTFARGTGALWWITLEHIVAKAYAIEAPIGHGIQLDTSTLAGKHIAFERLHAWLRSLPSDQDISDMMAMLCNQQGVSNDPLSRNLCMSWGELRLFAQSPLVTIGGHTVTHGNLAKMTAPQASEEIAANRADIQDALQRPVAHFAYPYGDKTAATPREFHLTKMLGYKTAMTTGPGLLFAENANHLTSLPRISLNGNYQDKRFLSVLTSGAATAMWSGLRRIDTA
jgi:peptidoglycan/xylan/chitin deacetylase (PgdA/CDA1 family)